MEITSRKFKVFYNIDNEVIQRFSVVSGQLLAKRNIFSRSFYELRTLSSHMRITFAHAYNVDSGVGTICTRTDRYIISRGILRS